MPDRVACDAVGAARFLSACDHETPVAIAYQSQPYAAPKKRGAQFGGRSEKKHPTPTAEQVMRSFNTWSFKREQPSDLKLLLRVIAAAIEQHSPVPFVLYWGKGPRSEAGEPELQCLDYLASLMARVRHVYEPGGKMTLILTDTHAELNGHPAQNIRQYFDTIKPLAEQRGFTTCWLGSLVKASGSAVTAVPIEDVVAPEALAKLVASAQKWYRGGGTAQDGALIYLRMNLIEQRVVERAFPGSIFVTFNGSEMRFLFPKQLPIFYMYSLRRGVSIKPWFLPAPERNLSLDQSTPLRPDAA